MSERHYSLLDQALIQIERGLTTLLAPATAARVNPAATVAEQSLTPQECRHSAGLMRVNHCGEVCAQALYYGQLMVARNPTTRDLLQRSANEETDHLAWTQQRLLELNSHKSYLNLGWYLNSLLIGMLAGIAGDSWSLGFVEETERQVAQHLSQHLTQLPAKDAKSRTIIEHMRNDEEHHGLLALTAGAKSLPYFIKQFMRLQAKLMTTLAYWL